MQEATRVTECEVLKERKELHPLCNFLMAICRLHIPKHITTNIDDLNNFTEKYAIEWYKNNKEEIL